MHSTLTSQYPYVGSTKKRGMVRLRTGGCPPLSQAHLRDVIQPGQRHAQVSATAPGLPIAESRARGLH